MDDTIQQQRGKGGEEWLDFKDNRKRQPLIRRAKDAPSQREEGRKGEREGGRKGTKRATYHTALAKACGWRARLPSASGA